jgi:hypothetical protein
MSDPVGTVRREEHDGGYSIWVLVHRALIQGYGSEAFVWANPEWLCIDSTATGNCGQRFAADNATVQTFPVIGAVPGTEVS